MNNEFEDSDTVPQFTFLETAKYHSPSKLKALTPPNPSRNLHPDLDPDSKDAWEFSTARKSKRIITSKLVIFCLFYLQDGEVPHSSWLLPPCFFFWLAELQLKKENHIRFPTRKPSIPQLVTLNTSPDPNPNSNLSKHGNWIKTDSLFMVFVHLSESCRGPSHSCTTDPTFPDLP